MMTELKRFNAGQSALPIYTSLRRWDPDQSLASHIQREIAELNGASFAGHFSELAALGKISVALDGFDEIPTEVRVQAMSGLRIFLDEYPRCRTILTTRWGVEPGIAHFQRVEIRPLEFSQIRELSYHKLWSDRSWENFLGQLAAEPDVLQLARNPLLLTLLIARFSRNEVKPSYLNEVLDLTTQALMDEWDALRGILRWQSGGLSSYRKAAYLRVIATYLTENDRHSFTVSEIAGPIGKVSQDIPADILLARLQESTSIICQVDDEQWSFTHRIFHEYFSTMHWMARLRAAVQTIVARLRQSPEREVVQRYRLLGGLASDTTDLFTETFGAISGHSIGVALALTEAMTQRLTVDPNILVSYGEYVRIVLERYLGNAQVLESVPVTSVEKNILTFLAPVANTPEEESLLIRLFEAMHRVRQGSGGEALSVALAKSRSNVIRQLARLICVEGTFEIVIEDSREVRTMNLAVHRVSEGGKATTH
jgi:hypothetical protein